MPIYTKTIRGTHSSIVLPVVEQLTTRILSGIGAGELFTDNTFYISDKTFDEEHRVRIKNYRCNVNIDYSGNPTTAKWEDQRSKPIIAYGITNRYKTEDIPLFYDKRPEISMKEHLTTCTIKLSIELQVMSIDLAHTLMDAILSKHHTASVVEYKDIYYTYPLPTDILLLLYKFYKLRKFTSPVPFKKYLQAGSNNGMGFDKNRQGTDTEVVVLKNNSRVLTEITYEQNRPVVELINQIPDHYTIAFDVDIQFMRPTNMVLYYPVVIDNSLIPKAAYPKISTDLKDNEVLITDTAEQKYIFLQYSSKYYPPLTRFPLFDDWNLPDGNYVNRSDYREFFIGAFTLDSTTTDGVTTINESTNIDLINHMPPEYQCHPIIQDALKIQGNSSFYIEGLFNISIFANEDRLDRELLSIDENLVINIKATIPHKRYHIVISELTNLSKLNPIYIPIIFHYADFFQLYLIRNIKYLVDSGELLWDDRYITIGKTRMIRLPDGSFTINTDHDPGTYGISYEDLGGYGEAINHYLTTKQGYPILKGGSNGINYPWRIGKYTFVAKAK